MLPGQVCALCWVRRGWVSRQELECLPGWWRCCCLPPSWPARTARTGPTGARTRPTTPPRQRRTGSGGLVGCLVLASVLDRSTDASLPAELLAPAVAAAAPELAAARPPAPPPSARPLRPRVGWPVLQARLQLGGELRPAPSCPQQGGNQIRSQNFIIAYFNIYTRSCSGGSSSTTWKKTRSTSRWCG